MNIPPNVLVTGGAGFIGSAMVRHIDNLAFPYVLDSLTYAGSRDNLPYSINDNHFFHASINDVMACVNVLRKVQPSIVFNFAAESHVQRSLDSASPFVETNALGVTTLLEACLTYWRTLRVEEQETFRFVQISTDEVYGCWQRQDRKAPWTEADAIEPRNPYAASKAAGELVAQSFWKTYGLPVIVVRGSNNYGPRQHTEKFIALAITNLLHNKPITLHGDGYHIREWVYVYDFCAGVWLAAIKGRPGAVYNLGGENPTTVREVAAMLCHIFGQRFPTVEFVPDRPNNDRIYMMSSTLAKHELGWERKWSFRRGLEETMKWYAQSQQGEGK